MVFKPQDMAVMFYRLGWKKRMKDWSKEKKRKVLKEMSDISLRRPIIALPPEEKIKLKSVPKEEFSGLQLYAGMVEISQDLGFPISTEIDQMVEMLSKELKEKKKKKSTEVVS